MFPRLTPAAGASPQASNEFSFELYLKHREYNALIGALAMMIVLIARMLFFPR
jgi:hypothetical protein